MNRHLARTLAATTGAAATVALAAVPAYAQAAPCVEKVAVVNNGGFTMDFQLTTREGQLTAETDTYPINQWRVIDLTSTTIAEGADVRPLVHATAGTDVQGNVFVSYCTNGQTATYTASGTTLDYQVTLLT
ncbi:hypothetical protein [Mangrovihabitans endophyticus]|uniref:Uncharacterized protein n=1 Tax=Mangrovihabitans endophyticus TaxID=1751298 RepID=A0A8J3FP42_9ACTN|nr:hypothetical protein [Mangrovihabitans endophyticus]GGK96481.1 hypothetical protein GCM10012284_33390 [Mangrovihabitans endophyticus]